MRRPDDPRIKLHCVPHAAVRVGRGVVPHDEVVALAVLHLVAHQRPREGVDAVVLDAADHAALAEDDLAAGYGDSATVSCCPFSPPLLVSAPRFYPLALGLVCRVRLGENGGGLGRKNVLLHLGKVARSYLNPVSNLERG